MKKIYILLAITFFYIATPLYAAQSTITEADAYSCVSYDKSQKQAEEEALANAKRKAAENAATYIKSETHMKDAMLEKDLVDAYSRARVKIIQEIDKGWYDDKSFGRCYRIKIKAEVVPDESSMQKLSSQKQLTEDPSAPLNVQVWSDKKEYKQGERMKVFIRGNKPFYARLLYRDTSGNLIQMLPNPHRRDNYFNGGVTYEIPSGNDRFEMVVSPPFGQESFIVYASTSPVGELDTQVEGSFYSVRTRGQDVGVATRGVSLKAKDAGKGLTGAEFFESKTEISTRQ